MADRNREVTMLIPRRGTPTMFTHLDRDGVAIERTRKGTTVQINGDPYPIVTRYTDFCTLHPEQSYVDIGCGDPLGELGREWILFSSKSKPVIELHKKDFAELYVEPAQAESLDEVLRNLCAYIHKTYIRELTEEEQESIYNADTQPYVDMGGKPVKYLEDILERRDASCRHLSIFTGLLLAKLIKHGQIPPGQVYKYRFTTGRESRHAVTMYIPHAFISNEISKKRMQPVLILDSTQNACYPVVPEFKDSIDKRYGRGIFYNIQNVYLMSRTVQKRAHDVSFKALTTFSLESAAASDDSALESQGAEENSGGTHSMRVCSPAPC